MHEIKQDPSELPPIPPSLADPNAPPAVKGVESLWELEAVRRALLAVPPSLAIIAAHLDTADIPDEQLLAMLNPPPGVPSLPELILGTQTACEAIVRQLWRVADAAVHRERKILADADAAKVMEPQAKAT